MSVCRNDENHSLAIFSDDIASKRSQILEILSEMQLFRKSFFQYIVLYALNNDNDIYKVKD